MVLIFLQSLLETSVDEHFNLCSELLRVTDVEIQLARSQPEEPHILWNTARSNFVPLTQGLEFWNFFL